MSASSSLTAKQTEQSKLAKHYFHKKLQHATEKCIILGKKVSRMVLLLLHF